MTVIGIIKDGNPYGKWLYYNHEKREIHLRDIEHSEYKKISKVIEEKLHLEKESIK